MELDDLLNAILEVTQAVARIPCTPQDKKETLDCVKKLFIRYNAVSTLFSKSAPERSRSFCVLRMGSEDVNVERRTTSGDRKRPPSPLQKNGRGKVPKPSIPLH